MKLFSKHFHNAFFTLQNPSRLSHLVFAADIVALSRSVSAMKVTEIAYKARTRKRRQRIIVHDEERRRQTLHYRDVDDDDEDEVSWSEIEKKISSRVSKIEISKKRKRNCVPPTRWEWDINARAITHINIFKWSE